MFKKWTGADDDKTGTESAISLLANSFFSKRDRIL